jgi:hypothetical protein
MDDDTSSSSATGPGWKPDGWDAGGILSAAWDLMKAVTVRWLSFDISRAYFRRIALPELIQREEITPDLELL